MQKNAVLFKIPIKQYSELRTILTNEYKKYIIYLQNEPKPEFINFIDYLVYTDFRIYLPSKCYFHPYLDKVYDQHEIIGDGNCLFNSIQLGIPRIARLDSITSISVRQMICDNIPYFVHTYKEQLKKNETGLSILQSVLDSDLVSDDLTEVEVNKYITHMRKHTDDPTYGTRFELLIAQVIFDVNIYIYTMAGDLDNTYELAKESVFLGRQFKDTLILYNCASSSTRIPIHFELLTLKTDISSVMHAETVITEEHRKQLQEDRLDANLSRTGYQQHIRKTQVNIIRDLIMNSNSDSDIKTMGFEDTYITDAHVLIVWEIFNHIKDSGPLTDDDLRKLHYSEDDINRARAKLAKLSSPTGLHKTKYLTLKKNTNLLYK